MGGRIPSLPTCFIGFEIGVQSPNGNYFKKNSGKIFGQKVMVNNYGQLFQKKFWKNFLVKKLWFINLENWLVCFKFVT
jgi:hypothetical protein